MARWRRNTDDRESTREAMRQLGEIYARNTVSVEPPRWWVEADYGRWPRDEIAARLRADQRDG